MKGSEWTLIFFTLLMQCAVGLILTFGIVNTFTGWKNNFAGSKEINDKILLVSCILMIAAMIISFLHLGNVKNAIYTLNNISGSWLSREILFVLLFGFFLVLFSVSHCKDFLPVQVKNVLLILSILSGISLLFVMSKLYMLEVVPAWNNIYTPLFFYFSAFILGAISYAVLTTFFAQKGGAVFVQIPGMQSLIKAIVLITAILLIAEISVWLFHLFTLPNGERAALVSYNTVLKNNFILFASRIILQALAVYLLGYFFVQAGKGEFRPNLFYLTYAAIILSEIAGRYLFYAMYERVGV